MNRTPNAISRPMARTTASLSELAVVIDHLSDILARENEALRDRRRDVLADLVKEKVNACRAYEAQVKALSGDGEIPDVGDERARQSLRGLAERMTELAVENHNRLKVAVTANRKLADTVAEAVKSATPGPGVYSRYGTVDRGRPSGAAAPMAISVNHTL